MTANPWDVLELSGADDTAEQTYTSVGKALSAWEGMEHHLAFMFGFFCSGNDSFAAMRAYGSVISFSGRASMLWSASEAYFHRRPTHKFKERFEFLLRRAEKFSPRRNEIAHGIVTVVYVDKKDGKELWLEENQKWVLLPTEYATNKRTLLPLEYGRIETHARYVYSSVEIDTYCREFGALREQLFSLMYDWGEADPSGPAIPV